MIEWSISDLPTSLLMFSVLLYSVQYLEIIDIPIAGTLKFVKRSQHGDVYIL